MIALPSLYPHQEDIRDRTRASLAKHQRVILCANTGVGKTRTAKWILGKTADRAKNGNQSGKSLFCVQRRGLVDNAIDSFNEEPPVRHGVIMSGRETAYGSRIQIASIDTLLSWFIEDGDYPSDVTFDLIVFDECVTGDATIETELGPMRLDEVPAKKPATVKTYSPERGVHFGRILNWFPKGKRATIEVHTHAGKIQCTPDHEIYTRRGWLQAQFLSRTDEILACVGAEGDQHQDGCFAGGTGSELLGHSLRHSGRNFTRMPRHASADVASKFGQGSSIWMRGSGTSIGRNTISSLTGTQTHRPIRGWFSRLLSGKRSSGRFLATLLSPILTRDLGPHDSTARMVTFRGSGRNIKPRSCTASTRKLLWQRMMAGARSLCGRLRRATQHWRTSTDWSGRTARSGLHANGSMALAISGLHGGFATTDPAAVRQCFSIPRGIPKRKTQSSPNGFATPSAKQPSSTTNTAHSSASQAGRRLKSASESNRTCPTACGTSWHRVTKIVNASEADVFDIEVEGSHCFFANDLLVHNCHSHHPKLAKFLKYHDQRREELGQHPAYVIGLSATPQAAGLSDVYKEIVMGPSAEWLIENQYLSPYRYVRATQGALDKLKMRGGEFTKGSECLAMEGLAGDLVRDWKKWADGRPTVGFFPRRSHAKDAQKQLEAAGVDVDYVDGDTPDEVRKILYHQLNTGQLDYLCNVQVIERGTDIPAISCVQLCVAVGSITRYRQMIGRGSRMSPGKEDCLVLDHGGNVKRHGFFEDDPEWTLDIRTKKAGEQGARPTIECPKCQAVYRGGKCKQCGYEPQPKERTAQGLTFDGTELKEITRDSKPKDTPTKTPEELMISALYMAGKSGRTFRQSVGIYYHLGEKQGQKHRVPRFVTVGGHRYQMVPYNHPDGSRFVRMLYPFTAGGHHGGKWHVENKQTAGAAW